MCSSFFILIVGLFLNDVTSYNPLLTYTTRYKTITTHPNIFADYSIDQFRGKQFVNGNITINSNRSIDSVVVVFYRCKLEGTDCEYFQTWKFTDICSKLKEKNQVWTSWYNAFDPPMVCPINKVHYKIRNATFDIGPALIIYSDVVDFQWKVIQKFYSGDVFIGSYTMVIEFFGFRKKIKSILAT